MANKRILKKSIDDLGNAMIEEMSIGYFNIENADKQLISSAINKILTAMNEAHKLCDVKFDKKHRDFESTKEYLQAKRSFIKENYDKLIADFNNLLEDALKDYNKAIPASEREANKKMAAE